MFCLAAVSVSALCTRVSSVVKKEVEKKKKRKRNSSKQTKRQKTKKKEERRKTQSDTKTNKQDNHVPGRTHKHTSFLKREVFHSNYVKKTIYTKSKKKRHMH